MTQTIVTDKDEKYNAFLYDPLYQLKTETKWSQKAGGGGLISMNREGTKRYYHFDGLGSTAALTDFDMNVTDTYVYSAFGITESSSGSSVNPFRFVGQWGYYDDGARGGQSGLLLLGVRYYSPEFGRFWSKDVYKKTYSYTNCPTLFVDPSGRIFTRVGNMLGNIYDHTDPYRRSGKGYQTIRNRILKWPLRAGAILAFLNCLIEGVGVIGGTPDDWYEACLGCCEGLAPVIGGGTRDYYYASGS